MLVQAGLDFGVILDELEVQIELEERHGVTTLAEPRRS